MHGDDQARNRREGAERFTHCAHADRGTGRPRDNRQALVIAIDAPSV